jgi:hypothetical protein
MITPFGLELSESQRLIAANELAMSAQELG